MLFNPVFRILTKSPSSTLQSTLHALFLPTPFKFLTAAPDDVRKRAPEEVLKPGALYAECAVVPVHIPASSIPRAGGSSEEDKDKEQERSNGDSSQPDDGELGGVALGMQVWDDYERELKVWDEAQAQANRPEK
jgi:hypothetical protein